MECFKNYIFWRLPLPFTTLLEKNQNNDDKTVPCINGKDIQLDYTCII